MPEVDGFWIADQIKKNPRLGQPKIVMLTSVGVRGDAAKCREAGIRTYLTKPVKRSDLLDVVKLALALRDPGRLRIGLEHERGVSVWRQPLQGAGQGREQRVHLQGDALQLFSRDVCFHVFRRILLTEISTSVG